jgi:hypothetical protein
MAIKRQRRDHEIDPFSDLLFNALLVFVFLFVIALVAMNPKAKRGDIESKAEVIITTNWADFSPNDVDTWVQDPAGQLLWFRNRDIGLMHLDRDDRGNANDVQIVNGVEVANPLNQEVVTLRGIAPGEYTVNLHYYKSQDKKPMEATVSVVKVNPRAQVVFYGTVALPEPGVERTAVRFTVDAKGQIGAVNTLPKSIVAGS